MEKFAKIDDDINNGPGKEGFNPVTGFSLAKESRALLTRR